MCKGLLQLSAGECIGTSFCKNKLKYSEQSRPRISKTRFFRVHLYKDDNIYNELEVRERGGVTKEFWYYLNKRQRNLNITDKETVF